jgi:hypothetical protein
MSAGHLTSPSRARDRLVDQACLRAEIQRRIERQRAQRRREALARERARSQSWWSGVQS